MIADRFVGLYSRNSGVRDKLVASAQEIWVANPGGRILCVGRWLQRPHWRLNMEVTRITADSHQLGGVPCIRRLRIPVATIVGMVAEGMTTAEILQAYPDLVEDDVREALRFAAAAVRERDLPIATSL